MIARAPASSANLGPGFDTLALALSLYVEVEAELSERFEVSALGEGASIPADEDHLGSQVARHVLGHSNVRLQVRSQIPLGRGLGSSAAFVAACAAALGSEDPFLVASTFDGHPENAAASVFGGFVSATSIDSGYMSSSLEVDPRLAAIVAVPSIELKTKTARGVLPAVVDFGDATFNLGRMGLLVAGVANIDRMVSQATEDRLHQSHRSSLFPQSKEIMDVLTAAGCLASCWSGAGPTMIGFCSSGDSARIALEAARLLRGFEPRVAVKELKVDMEGLAIVDAYGPDFQPLEVASLF